MQESLTDKYPFTRQNKIIKLGKDADFFRALFLTERPEY